MDLVKNEVGKQAIADQLKTMRWQKGAALGCLLLFPFCLLCPGWLKFAAILPLLGSLYIDRQSRFIYEETLYLERDKERLAQYIEAGLPGYTVMVNPQICTPHPHLLVIGTTGVFVILIASKGSLEMNKKGDHHARTIQSALQNLIPESPVKTIIYFSQATMLKPAIGRITVVSSLFGLINQIQTFKGMISLEESQALVDKLRA